MNSGKRKNITLDDYVIASLMIYFDWINVLRTCWESIKNCREKSSNSPNEGMIEILKEDE